MRYFSNKIKELIIELNKWTVDHQFNLTIYNLIIITLFVLRSAGYFHPFFPITVNFIVSFSLVLSIFLLNARSRSLFVVTILFWIFAAFLRVLGINVWAERTAVYSYQAFFIGVLLLVFEVVFNNKKKK